MLQRHPDLQEEFWEFFQQLHEQPSPIATSCDATETDLQASEQSETGRERQEESGRPVDAKNISVTMSGEKVVIWTRSEPNRFTHTDPQACLCCSVLVTNLTLDLLHLVSADSS